MAMVRVYLLTYQRNQLLPRALKSLLDQSFTDWICELHNDCPADPFPGELVRSTADPRLQLVQHSKNLGANRTFNLVFQPCPEEFVVLLEDDNWWEPDFLQTMVRLLKAHPSTQVAWSNMRIWQERSDGGWENTGRLIWESGKYSAPTWFHWPDPRSFNSLVHSNAGALVRNGHLDELVVPEKTPLIAMEPIRERAMRFPLLFCPEPLVNFSWTVTTAREKSPLLAAQMAALLTALFLKHAGLERVALAQWVDRARSGPVNEVGGLLVSAFLVHRFAGLARHVHLSEWPRIVGSFVRHLRTNLAILQTPREHAELWQFVDQCTARRFVESRVIKDPPRVVKS